MNRKPLTWGDIFWRYVRAGNDHGWAAFAADEWQKRKQQEAEKRGRGEGQGQSQTTPKEDPAND